ncbi:MAG: autotransporter-associated beta strand repeat-containing protein [Pirellulales bacterium]
MAVGLTAGSTTAGVISGADGSNLVKAGAQVVSFCAANTYSGYTQINQGTIVVTGDVLPGVAGPLGNSVSPINLAGGVTNIGGGLGIGGKYVIGRDVLVSVTTGTGSSLIENRTNETAVVTGAVSLVTGGVLTLGSASADVTTFRGGVLDIQGVISGAGSLIIGTTATAPGNGGTVRLTASSFGYGANTYSGGTTLQSGRLQITSDTFYSGPATSPTILSGPLGTGTLTFGVGESNRGGTIEAVGGPRIIVNALGADAIAGSSVRSFSGREALTFTRDYNINSDGTLRNRTFTTNSLYQPVTFSGNFSNSGAGGANLVKSGAGLLVLTGVNTQANLTTSDGNYGTGVFIDAGILRVNADAALGSTASLAAAGSHLVGPADVRLRGGVLQIAAGFTTARQFILTAASGIDVAAGQTLTLSTQTAGAFGLTKTGPGTLALNNSANTITALVLGGAQQINPNVGLFGLIGGTVSTTATSGTPFATASITLNSGTLSLVGGGTAQSLSIPTLSYGPAGAIALNRGATTSTLTVATTFARQGTFNGVNYGTLTINPSLMANLASIERVLVSAGAPANSTLTGGDILSVPSIFAALAGSGQDADFTRYDAANGLARHSVTTVGTLTASAATNVGDISAPAVVGAAPGDVVDIAALRLTADVTSFDGSQLLRINTGGLIFNGATAPQLSVNTLFGTGTGASLREAIVYVRDGQTGSSTISGNVTALDFTKTGPGTLTLSGNANQLNTSALRLPVLSIQNGTLRFASTAAQFTNPNRPANLNAQLGGYVLNVNEAGVFDLNGLNTTVGGLAGNGTVTSNAAGTIDFRSFNGVGVDTTFSGLIADGAGTVRFTKSGDGVLIVAGHGSYTGGTFIEAGRITSAYGSAAAGGRLEAQKVTALGTGPLTLRGGTLTLNAANYFNSAQTTSDVADGLDYNLWGGPNGYDVIIAATASTRDAPLPVNMTSTFNAGTQNAGVNSLTINAPMLTTTAGVIQVVGATNINQNVVIRTAGGRLFLAGKVTATGDVVKTGANDLVLSHTEGGVNQNTIGGIWKVYGGILNPRSADGAANPLGANAVVEIATGGTANGLLLSTDGDGTAAAEMVTTYADTTVRFGSLLGVSSNEFISSGLGRISTDRILANNDDKTVVIKNLQIGGVLGSAYMLTTGGNSDSLWVQGTTTFVRDFYLQNDLRLTLNGAVSGNGTLVKRGGAELFVNAVNTYAGGTVLGAGGTTIFGSFEGNQVTLNETAQLGGLVMINALSRLLVNGTGNVQAGQAFYVGGNLNNMGLLGVGADVSLDAIGYRSASAGGIQPSATNYYLGAVNPSQSVLAINTIYTQTLDQTRLGDGMGFLGSTTNYVGANGMYDAATLGAGLGNTYRLGGGGATLFIGYSNANVLSNNALTGAINNLVVGAPLSVENNGVVGNGSGTVVLLSSNNYGGTTLINRASTLDFRGTLATSAIEAYGVLNVAGEAGTFIGAGAVTLRPGSTLRFDNTSAGVLPVSAAQGRWSDATAVNLNSSTLRLQGNAAVEVQETVGAVQAFGGSVVEVVRRRARTRRRASNQRVQSAE